MALLEVADSWAEQTTLMALLLQAKGELDVETSVAGTIMRSMFMLGSQVGIAIAAIDMAGAVDIRNQMAEEMAELPHDEGVPHEGTSKIINAIALMVIEAHRRGS